MTPAGNDSTNLLINRVYPWGRNLHEYRAMFRLQERDLAGSILGCGDGPASFNAELSEQGGQVISCDPLYRFSAEEIRRRIDQTAPRLIERCRQHRECFVWNEIPSPEALGRRRLAAMHRFLEDYPAGRAQGRYVIGALPRLPFTDNQFALALSSHFLMLYSLELGLEFHRRALREMLRVAREVRIFPLLDMEGTPSALLAPLTEGLIQDGIECAIEAVDYEFQKGGNEMWRLRRSP